ncbi:MAG: N-acetylmuramoyl-L-alanine amidase [Candidatus Sumerlaeaceae bacterium]|nr:N-acetylmuramoyl-L-alanine amidase [Candidatus Sumerlaeaceae bacterium]
MASHRIAKFTEAELQALAGVTTLKKVVLDPDDGPDPAAGSLGKEASELSLELARKVEARLKMRGIETELTRSSSQAVSLGRKLEIVTNSGAQALVSLRIGISGFSDASGARVFYTNDSVDFRMGRPAVREAGGTAAPEANYLPFQQRNKALALALLDAVKRATPREGSEEASPVPLWLARRAPMASAMVMPGYITNSLDALILRDPQRQDALADALAEAIANFGAALEAPAPASSRRPGVASAP